jgi:hypothetical protein
MVIKALKFLPVFQKKKTKVLEQNICKYGMAYIQKHHKKQQNFLL